MELNNEENYTEIKRIGFRWWQCIKCKHEWDNDRVQFFKFCPECGRRVKNGG